MDRDELVHYLNEYLKVGSIPDESRNGLQVEGGAEVQHIALAVDACLEAFQKAGEAGAEMIIVHHGLFWEHYHPLTGNLLRRVRALLDRGITLYGAHLPLDMHPEVGNNVQLARLLGLEETGPFGYYHGNPVGVQARPRQDMSAQDLAELVEERLRTPVTLQAYGPHVVKKIGIVSGGGAEMIAQAGEDKLDLFLTGERSHSFAHLAEELGIHVVYAGHYATETVGVKALGQHLAEHFGLQTTFIDAPTGL